MGGPGARGAPGASGPKTHVEKQCGPSGAALPHATLHPSPASPREEGAPPECRRARPPRPSSPQSSPKQTWSVARALRWVPTKIGRTAGKHVRHMRHLVRLCGGGKTRRPRGCGRPGECVSAKHENFEVAGGPTCVRVASLGVLYRIGVPRAGGILLMRPRAPRRLALAAPARARTRAPPAHNTCRRARARARGRDGARSLCDGARPRRQGRPAGQ